VSRDAFLGRYHDLADETEQTRADGR